MKAQKVKEWVEHHWYRLNSTGSTPPPLPISLPIMLVVLSMEFFLKAANAIWYYGTLQFIFAKLDKKLVPNGTVSERLLLILKLFCILLVLLMVMKLTTK
jgi:hypothetical protein